MDVWAAARVSRLKEGEFVRALFHSTLCKMSVYLYLRLISSLRFIVLLLLGFCGVPIADSQDSSFSLVDFSPVARAEFEWVQEVLLNPEVVSSAGQKQSGVRLWTKSPVVSIHYATDVERALAIDAVAKLNEVARDHGFGTLSVKPKGKGTGDLRVIFGALKDFPRLHKKYAGVRYPEGNWGTYWYETASQSDFMIRKGTVFIAKLEEDWGEGSIEHFLLEEITQVLGFINDSHRYPSVFSVSGQQRNESFTSRDKALIAWAYSELRPGMSRSQLRQEFDRSWLRYRPGLLMTVDYADWAKRYGTGLGEGEHFSVPLKSSSGVPNRKVQFLVTRKDRSEFFSVSHDGVVSLPYHSDWIAEGVTLWSNQPAGTLSVIH